MPSPRFGLALLGGFELTGPGGVIDLPSKKLAGLLAYLACTAPKAQSREKLSALLWGSHFDAQAKQNLRQALTRLRKLLGQDALHSDGESVWLNAAAVSSDVGQFEALVREGSRDALSAAADLYQGRLVDGLAVGEESWNEWLAGERERLLDLAVGTLVGLGERELAAGCGDQALRAGRRAIALNNLREDAHRLLVQALAATGRKAEALKHYQVLAALLKRELNTAPDAATRALAAELRTSEPSTRSPVVDIAEPLPKESPLHPAAGDDAASSVAAARPGGAERRHLTIMACNMVDSAALSARLDPEDMRDLVAAFHKGIADVVSRFDGFVAQYVGDGVLVYFGYPVAREHDTEQAVHAGLALLDAVGGREAAPGVALRARVGIATSLVVVSDDMGDAGRPVAIGQAPGLAVRLQAAAAPGEVVIADSTWRQVGRLFDCRALDAIEVNGLPEPVAAWQVRGETAGVTRFEARRAGALYPLIGRQEEIELLQRRWDHVKHGEGRVVLLSGEPGIGKSRIAESLLARLDGEPHARLRYFCSPHHGSSPLYPVVAQLERAAGFEADTAAAVKLDRLEALLAPRSKNVRRDVALVAELLGVPPDGRFPAVVADPPQKREMTLAAFLDQVDGAAAQGPVLVVVEDIHWIDPTSRDLLDRLVARATDLPVLLVVTARQELQPAWIGQPQVTTLPLSRLGRRDSTGIVAGVTGEKALPDAVLEQVLAHADGVPLFIEELTHTLLESGLLHETADRYVLDGPLPPLAVPTTLQASLVARLDGLSSIKDVAQIGAVIGREFSHELIAAVSDVVPIDLDATLERLTASGLVFRRGLPPDATYTFKHALVQDAAYATMPRRRRQQLHASIAKVLIDRFPALAESLPEIVARHFDGAGLAREAIDYWLKAALRAQARFANRESVTSFEQAQLLLGALPPTRETLQRAIDLRFDLKNTLVPLGGFEQIAGHLQEAERMARSLDDQRRLGETFAHMCHIHWITGYPAKAVTSGENAQAIAEALGDVPLQMTASFQLGAACMWVGDYRRAEGLLLRVLHLLDGDPNSDRAGFPRYHVVTVHAYLTSALYGQGKFEEAIAHGQEGIRLGEALNSHNNLANVCLYLANLHVSRRDIGRAVPLIEHAQRLCREWKLTMLSESAKGILGHAYAVSGRIAEGIPLMEQAVSAFETMRHGVGQSLFLMSLGEAYILADRLADALDCARRALAIARQGGQRGHEARALWLLGEATARRNLPDDAEDHYRKALALAEALGMRPLAAHCHLGLGKLYRRKSKLDQARRHLADAAAMYREMHMSYWLEQAEAA